MEIRERKESLPSGGWHTVRRVLMPSVGLGKLVCPRCGNKDDEKWETEVRGATLHGFLCMNCVAS